MEWQPINKFKKSPEYFLILLRNMSLKQKKCLKQIDLARWDGKFFRDKTGLIIDDEIIQGWQPLPPCPVDKE